METGQENSKLDLITQKKAPKGSFSMEFSLMDMPNTDSSFLIHNNKLNSPLKLCFRGFDNPHSKSSTISYYNDKINGIIFEIMSVMMIFQFACWLGMSFLVKIDWQATFNENIFSNFYSGSLNSYQELYSYFMIYFLICFVGLHITQKKVAFNKLVLDEDFIKNNSNESELFTLLVSQKDREQPRMNLDEQSKDDYFSQQAKKIFTLIEEKLGNPGNSYIRKILFLYDCSEYCEIKQKLDKVEIPENKLKLEQRLNSIEKSAQNGSLYKGTAIITFDSIKVRNGLLNRSSKNNQLESKDGTKFQIQAINPRDLIYKNIYINRKTSNKALDFHLVIFTIIVLALKIWISNLNNCLGSTYDGTNPLCDIKVLPNAEDYLTFDQGILLGLIYIFFDSILQIGYKFISKNKIFISRNERERSRSAYTNWTTFLNFIVSLLVTYYYQSPLLLQYQAFCIMLALALKSLLCKVVLEIKPNFSKHFGKIFCANSIAPTLFLWAAFSIWSPLKFGFVSILSLWINTLFGPNKKKISIVSGIEMLNPVFWLTSIQASATWFFTLWNWNLTAQSLPHTQYTIATYITAWVTCPIYLIIIISCFLWMYRTATKLKERAMKIFEERINYEDLQDDLEYEKPNPLFSFSIST